MNIQVVIVVLIIIAAIFYVARNIYKSLKGDTCESGNCGCDAKPHKTISHPYNKQQ